MFYVVGYYFVHFSVINATFVPTSNDGLTVVSDIGCELVSVSVFVLTICGLLKFSNNLLIVVKLRHVALYRWLTAQTLNVHF